MVIFALWKIVVLLFCVPVFCKAGRILDALTNAEDRRQEQYWREEK